MASVIKVRRLANPRRRRNVQGYVDASGFHPIRASSDYDPDRAGDGGDDYIPVARKRAKKKKMKAKTKKRAGGSVKRRRKLSPKQIRIFGTKAQKAALKRKRRKTATASNPRKRRRSNSLIRSKRTVVYVNRGANPKRKKRTVRSVSNRKHSSKRNPVPIIVTLGAVNPQKRRTKSMAKKRYSRKAKANPRRQTRVVVAAPRKRRYTRRVMNRRRRVANPRRRSIRHNPMFGAAGGGMVKAVLAGLGGVAVGKFIVGVLPSQLTSNSLLKIASTGASAFLARFAAKKAGASDLVADSILFGGLMYAGSMAINTFLPASVAGKLSLGEIIPGKFPVPFNTVTLGQQSAAAIAAPANSAAANKIMNMSGMARAYPSAF
jgi:hypothetical protein